VRELNSRSRARFDTKSLVGYNASEILKEEDVSALSMIIALIG
jgi:hypothetical protein